MAVVGVLAVRANHDRASLRGGRVLALVLALLMVGALGMTPASGRPPDVQWNKGSGPTQMSNGLPNPPGWYQAAVGRRTGHKVLYLTFDDGPSSFSRGLLKALRRNKSLATFFVTGRQATADPHALRLMRRDGHAVGHHTWDHPELTTLSKSGLKQQLRPIDSRVRSCMRPPYGLINSQVAHVALRAGYQPIMWTAHIEDWNPHSLSWTKQELRRVTRPGAVILLHETHGTTVAAVRDLLPWWRSQGYRLATVPSCTT